MSKTQLTLMFEENPDELRAHIEHHLRRAGGSIKEAAGALDVSVTSLNEWLRRLKMGHLSAQIRKEVSNRFRLTG